MVVTCVYTHTLKMERRQPVSLALFIFVSESRQNSIKLKSGNQRLANVVFP